MTPASCPPHLLNDVFLRALRCQPTEYTPIWFMRQAGRYLPEYKALRASAGSFLALMKNPDTATEVTLQPLARFPLDAAILFSDILTVPDAMGLGLSFAAGEGPRFENAVRDEAQINALKVPDIEASLPYVSTTIKQIRRELTTAEGHQKLPLIGFAGSPWTLACYMVEGGKSADFRTIKSMLYTRPDLLHRILDINARALSAYLIAQIEAGVNAVMIFDTWGGVLADQAFDTFSLHYTARIVADLHSRYPNPATRPPIIVFTKGGGQWLERILSCQADAVGLDWTTSLSKARERVATYHASLNTSSHTALQGNLDPMILLSSTQAVRAEVRNVLQAYGPNPGHIFNLGHGILPITPIEHVEAMVDEVHSASRAAQR